MKKLLHFIQNPVTNKTLYFIEYNEHYISFEVVVLYMVTNLYLMRNNIISSIYRKWF